MTAAGGPRVVLGDGVEMPQLGLGVFRVAPDTTAELVSVALAAGYRSIDTAAVYGNEEGVGEGISRSGVPREEVFVTTKVANPDQGYDETLRAFDSSSRRLRLEVVDLYLVHWPVPKRDRFVPTWRALESLQRDGRVRSIGVSNFRPSHLDRLARECDTSPVINQVPLHPYSQQRELREYHEAHGIVTESWGPIGRGGPLLEDPVVVQLAAEHRVEPAQVVLRWHLQHGFVAIPKSSRPERVRSNLAALGFELSAGAMAAIDALDRGEPVGPDPEEFG